MVIIWVEGTESLEFSVEDVQRIGALSSRRSMISLMFSPRSVMQYFEAATFGSVISKRTSYICSSRLHIFLKRVVVEQQDAVAPRTVFLGVASFPDIYFSVVKFQIIAGNHFITPAVAVDAYVDIAVYQSN